METNKAFEYDHRSSLGNDSISTIASSIAEKMLEQRAVSPNIDGNFHLTPRNVNIDGSKSIQVGEVIYNFYTPSPDDKRPSEITFIAL
jgi:hypothetical protein